MFDPRGHEGVLQSYVSDVTDCCCQRLYSFRLSTLSIDSSRRKNTSNRRKVSETIDIVMETQAEFAERWIAEYRVRTARTADWLLSHPDLPPRKFHETVQQRQANSTMTGITLVQKYEISWNHPRMREALRLYFYNNLRFDDKINLNQNEAPDDIDINPDFWNDVSQILKQLKYRDLSVDFGMAKYCPQFSSNDIDNTIYTYYNSYQSSCGSIDQSSTFSNKDLTGKDIRQINLPDRVTSPNGRDALRACGSVLRNPALVYQHLAVQLCTREDDTQISATDINRVPSPRAMNSHDEFYHGYNGDMHMTQCSASNVGAVTYRNITDSPAAYYREYAREMHRKQTNDNHAERVTSPDVTDSQAAFYHKYARRILRQESNYADLNTVNSPKLTDSPAAFYHKLARGMYREQIRASDIGRVISPGVQDSQAAYYHEYAKSMFQKTTGKKYCQEENPELSEKNGTNKSILCQELRHTSSEVRRSCLMNQNPLLRQLVRASNSVGFETPSVLLYTQTSQEISWKRIPLEMDLVMVNGKMIRDLSLKEIKGEYNCYTHGERSFRSLDVGLNDRVGVTCTTSAADRRKLLKQNDECKPSIRTCNNTNKPTESLSSGDSLQKAIREILGEDDLPNPCARYIRKAEIKALKEVSPKVVDNNDNERDSKSMDRQESTKEDYVDIAGGVTQAESQEEHSIEEQRDSIREKANANSQAQRKEVVSLQSPVNAVSEQTGTVCSNTQSSSVSLWSAGDFYKSVIIREQKQHGCGLNEGLIPSKVTQKICPRTRSVPSQCNQVGQQSPCHKNINNPDKPMRDSHLLGKNSEDRELSRCSNTKTPIPELKTPKSNKLLRFVRRKAAHLKSKISSLSCRSSIHKTK